MGKEGKGGERGTDGVSVRSGVVSEFGGDGAEDDGGDREGSDDEDLELRGVEVSCSAYAFQGGSVPSSACETKRERHPSRSRR